MPDETTPAATPRPAATIMLLRDSADGLEVFMVKRHHQIDFTPGALVFPGGRVSEEDARAACFADGAAQWSEAMLAFAVAGIREAFEESGILLARDAKTGEFLDAARMETLGHYRKELDSHQIEFAAVLEKENLRLACDALAHFAHWVTPELMPKRFDTHFFLAVAPPGQAGRHDGHESVDSVWISPDRAIADRKKWNVIFPTKLNLMKLAQSKNAEGALEAARASTIVTVTPWTEEGPDGRTLRIRDDAGYAQTSTNLREAF